MVDSAYWTEVAGGVLAVVLIVGAGYFTLLRLRARRSSLRRELADSPTFADDRAHNQIRIARAELAFLQREGIDVPAARTLLEQAEGELLRHENLDAVRHARAAQERLVAARRAPTAAPTPRPELLLGSDPGRVQPFGSTAPARPGPGSLRAVALPEEGEGTPGPSPPPKNRMEAHFQMTLLAEEIAAASKGGVPRNGAREAEAIRAQAQSAYGRQEYTDALRLALKGRRAVGAHLETLPPAKGTPMGKVPPLSGPSTDGGAAPEPRSPVSECPRCGRSGPSTDLFCRSCGAPRSERRCARCQTPLGDSDTFCGRCGAPTS